MMSGVGLQAQDSPTLTVSILKPATGFVYGYEGWKELGTVQKKSTDGVVLTGAAAGGAGIILNPAADLTGAKEIVVKIKTGATNTASKIIFKIVGLREWTIDLTTVSATEFTEVKLPLTTSTGAIPPDKLKDVKNVQVQGDFTPGKTVDVVFAGISAVVPDPAI